jgi:peptide/nickel transport system permease protein
MRLLTRESSTASSVAPHKSLGADVEEPDRPRGRLATFWRRLLRNRGATAGGLVLVLLVLVALAAPVVAPYDPSQQDVEASYQAPSLRHLLGTDNLGRDIMSRIIFGARISLRIGLISIGIAASLGVLVGLVTGYYGGLVDAVGMRLVDIMLAFPGILLALVIVSILGSSLTNLMIAVGIGAIPGFARLTRGSVLSIRALPYVEGARVIGCRDERIIRKYIFPNTLASLIVYATLGVASAILTGAALSFLGLGVQRPSPEWGVMLADGRDYLRQYWWMATFPGVAILITTLAVNMLGDGLRDIFDPRLYRD